MKPLRLDSKIFRNIRILSVAALASGAAMFFYGCENNIEQIKSLYSLESLRILEGTNFETIYTDSGQVRYSLKAPKLLRFEEEGRDYLEFPKGIEMVKYDEHQNIISSLTADYARQYVAEDKWEAKNDVVATNAQGDTLKTELLIWEEKKEIIYTEEKVTIVKGDQIIKGIGFTSDQKLQNWKIKHPTGTIYVGVKENTQDTNQGLEKSEENQKESTPENRRLKFSNK